MQAANGTQDQELADAISSEMTQIKASLQARGERDLQRPLHLLRHGDERPPYQSNAYAGTTLPVQRLIAPGQVMQVNKDGPSAFGVQSVGPPPTKNVFDVTRRRHRRLNTGNMTRSDEALTELDGSFTTAVNARTTVGAISNRLDSRARVLSAQELSVQGLLSRPKMPIWRRP